MTDLGNGLYKFVAKDTDTSTAADQATDLNLFLNSLEFAPRLHWAGDLTGNEGLEFTVVSKEKSAFADSSYGGSDNTSETETVTAYIDILVLPNPSEAPSLAPSLSPSGLPLSNVTPSVISRIRMTPSLMVLS